MKLESASNPEFIKFSAVDTLKTSDTKALLIYSDNDMLCSKKAHYDTLYGALAGKDNITFMLESGKGHNPNYTANAVKLLGEYVTAKNKLTKEKKLITDVQKKAFIDSFDWKAMTEQDERVWNAILKHLES